MAISLFLPKICQSEVVAISLHPAFATESWTDCDPPVHSFVCGCDEARGVVSSRVACARMSAWCDLDCRFNPPLLAVRHFRRPDARSIPQPIGSDRIGSDPCWTELPAPFTHDQCDGTDNGSSGGATRISGSDWQSVWTTMDPSLRAALGEPASSPTAISDVRSDWILLRSWHLHLTVRCRSVSLVVRSLHLHLHLRSAPLPLALVIRVCSSHPPRRRCR